MKHDVLDGFKLFLSKSPIELKLKKIGSGTEADIYKYNNKFLIKQYKKDLLIQIKEIYNEERILKIASMRDRIKNTNLLYGPVYINDSFIGALLYNHRFSPNLNFFDVITNINFKINKLLELTNNLKELEDNNIYHIDLISKNVLLQYMKDIKIIDIDGKSARFEEDRNGYYKNKMYGSLFDLVLEKLFLFDIDSYENNIFVENNINYLDIAFEKYDIDNSYIEEFNKEKYSYQLLRDFLLYLKDYKILQKKLS